MSSWGLTSCSVTELVHLLSSYVALYYSHAVKHCDDKVVMTGGKWHELMYLSWNMIVESNHQYAEVWESWMLFVCYRNLHLIPSQTASAHGNTCTAAHCIRSVTDLYHHSLAVCFTQLYDTNGDFDGRQYFRCIQALLPNVHFCRLD